MRDEQDRLAAAAELGELVEALVREALVADREHLVDQQHVRDRRDRDGEAEPHVHARRVRLDRRVDEVLQLGELDDLVEAALRSRASSQAEHDAVDEDVLAAGDLRDGSPAPSSISAEMRPSTVTVPVGRLGDARDELEQRALAGAVATDHAERRPFGTVNDTSSSAGNVSSGPQVADQAAATGGRSSASRIASVAVPAVDLLRR